MPARKSGRMRDQEPLARPDRRDHARADGVGDRPDGERQDEQDRRPGWHRLIVAGRRCQPGSARVPRRGTLRASEETCMTTRRAAWRRSDEVATDEQCTLTVRGGGLSLVGTIIGAEGGLPIRIEYRALADGSGLTTAVHVRDLRGFETRTIALERDAKGNWTGTDGAKVSASRVAPMSTSAAVRPRTRCPSVGSSSPSVRPRPSRRPGSGSRADHLQDEPDLCPP